MVGMVDYGIIKPELGGAFGAGVRASQTEQMQGEEAKLKLDQLKQDREAMLQFQQQLKAAGKDPDLNKVFDAMIATGQPDYAMKGIEGKRRLKAQEEFAKIQGFDMGAVSEAAPVSPAAPAPSMVRTPAAPAPTNALGTGAFGMEAPANALAARAPTAAPTMTSAPTNALAAQPNVSQIAQTQNRINALMRFAAANPEMSQQAMSQAHILQQQLELFSKRGPAPVAPTNLAKLQNEMAALPVGDPRRAQYEALIRKETTHAPGTTVQLPAQEKAFESELGKGQAESIIKSKTAAQDAASIIDTVNTGRDIMKSGMITGAGADFLVNLNQGLKTAGIDAGYADAAANSQAFTANMAGNVGKLIKQFGAGTGLSDADREFAKDMAGGRISLDSKAINRILDINERAARNVINRHNKDVKGIKTNIPLEVEPPAVAPSVATVAAPLSAVAYLRANPSMKSAFDAKYGVGAADRALKGR